MNEKEDRQGKRDPRPWFCRNCADRLATTRSTQHIFEFKPREGYLQDRSDYEGVSA